MISYVVVHGEQDTTEWASFEDARSEIVESFRSELGHGMNGDTERECHEIISAASMWTEPHSLGGSVEVVTSYGLRVAIRVCERDG